MKITAIDHLVLTVSCINTSCEFYQRVLGMRIIEFEGTRKALSFDRYKINLHENGKEIEPHARRPTAGSADLCLITDSTAPQIKNHLSSQNIAIEQGPVSRTGANGSIISFYLRDPDGNLIEISTYANS